MRKTMIQIRDVTKEYNGTTRALDCVSLDIAEGEWVAIMGPSGSGKTTLLNLLSCLDRPTRGTVTIDGADVTRLAANQLAQFRREKVGLVFQQFHLVQYLTALENVMLAQYFHSMPDAPEARAALEQVGLAERADHLPSQLSGGEQQRVCVARALINQPRIILADEPTGNLDEANEEIVLDLFRRMHARGHTVVIVTHDAAVGELADRVLRLEHGRLVGEESASRIALPEPRALMRVSV
ncbi:MAG: ABC transporter ATP-binding protein [Chloroflexi bacterium]|nr:ABC transporter ATP-binding protein [Chloroflexota bacterium]